MRNTSFGFVFFTPFSLNVLIAYLNLSYLS